MRPIDADALMALIETQRERAKTALEGDLEAMRATDGLFLAIEALIMTEPTVEVSEPQRWIPVDEGKPKDGTVCLVTDSKGLVEIATFAEDLYEFDEYDFHDKRGVAGWIYFDDEWGRYFDVENVVAWMPLPKPMELEED